MNTKLLIGALGVLWLTPATAPAQPFNPAPPDAGGRAEFLQDKFDDAVDDFTRAIATHPKMPILYDERSLAEIHQLKPDNAIADCNQAIALDKNYVHAYYDRGLAEQLKGGLDAAVDDYEHVVKVYPTNTDLPHFYLWIARVQLGQKDAASKELAAYLTTRPASVAHDFYGTLGDYLLGKMSEADFLKRANATPVGEDKGKATCAAYYFVGMKRLIAGDKLGATEAFRKSLETCVMTITEAPLAYAEFKALGGNP